MVSSSLFLTSLGRLRANTSIVLAVVFASTNTLTPTTSRIKRILSSVQEKRNKKARDILRRFLFDFLSSHPCVDCGEQDVVVLDFDHTKNKTTEVSSAVRLCWPLSEVKKEIEKCVVRCANCHRRKTAKERGWWQLSLIQH